MHQTGVNSVGGGLNSHNIFDEIISLENLFSAWREFKKGKRKRVDIQEFEFNLEDNLFQLHHELKNKTYRHGDYNPFYVADPKLRHIHKAAVRDRILHQAIFRILYPVFDKSFIFDSYSCRTGKGTHRAVNRLESFYHKLSHNNTRNIFALKCDIRKFFDSVDQDILMGLVKKKDNDKTIWFVGEIIKSFTKGLPLGNVTSQLFANIYLNELDQFIKHQLKEKYYIRYCDDFVILGENQKHLLEIANTIDSFLNERLKLSLHPNKIIIRQYRQGIDFLGYISLPHYRVLRTKTKRRLLKQINKTNSDSYLGALKYCNGFMIQKKTEKFLSAKT